MTGRAAKAEETKRRIWQSAAQLYAERPLDEFTLDDVAERAGTTVQTILRHYGSKDELIYVVLTLDAQRGRILRPTPPGDVAAAVRAIVEVYESIGDLVIRRLADGLRRPQLLPALEAARGRHRAWIEQTFAPQLSAVRGAARTQLFHCIVSATDVTAWNVLRRDGGLSRAATEAVIRRLVEGALHNSEDRTNGSNPVVELVGRR